uniref:Defensin 2 n=1 Tax=Lasioderma serricorne TaxID=295660 RepID=A0A8A4XDL7_9COLE|nr:defensin 2 [Lasioderma serricorne]
MNKILLAAFFVCAFAFATQALPVEDEKPSMVMTAAVIPDEPPKETRITCDVGSISIGGVSLNDSACALHCLAIGHKGGYCNAQKVCVCRD